MNPSGTGDLIITVGGDIGPLEQALSAVPEQLAGLSTAVQDSFAGLGVELDKTRDDLGALAGAVGETTNETKQLPPALDDVKKSSEGAGNSLVELATHLTAGLLTFEGLKAAAEELATEYGALEKAQIALGAMLGDQAAANEAIASVQELASSLGVAEDAAITTQQRLVALGESIGDIPRDMTAIADGAAAMGTEFGTAAQRFEMIVNSGALMQRSLLAIGLNINAVATAMGMTGVPAATLTAAFKALDEQQRAAVLSAAELTKNVDLAGKTAEGVTGAWTKLGNEISGAWKSAGEQVEGFKALADLFVGVVKVLVSAWDGFIAIIKIGSDVIIDGFIKPVTDGLVGLAKAFADLATGNFKQAFADLSDASKRMAADIENANIGVKDDFEKLGAAVSKTWGVAMDNVATSTKAGVGGTVTQINALQAAAQKAVADFNGVSIAFGQGKVSATAYTAALDAMNKAQMDANGGLQNFGTALLLAVNSFRQLQVAQANALTDLKAVVVAVDAGGASWTQYVAALEALNKAQEEASGGLQKFGTALSLVDAALEKMAIDQTNAQTYFNAVVAAMKEGDANAKQYTDALDALNRAQMDLNNGLQNAHTALLLAQNDYRQAGVTLANAQTNMLAVKDAFDSGTASLNQLIDATERYIKAQQGENDGLLNQATAMLEVANENTKLAISQQNANMLLAAAKQALDDGTISLGTYEKYASQAAQANQALSGTHKDAAASADTQTHSTSGLTGALGGMTTALHGVSSAINDNAGLMSVVNGQWVNLGTTVQGVSDHVSQMATNMAVVNGQFVTIGDESPIAADGVSQLGDSIAYLDGQLVKLDGAASGASKAISGIGQAASSAQGSVDSLAGAVQSVSQDFAEAMGGQTAPMSFQLRPGDVISYLTGTGALGGFFGGTRDTITWDPANSPAALAAKAIDDAARAAGMVWTHKGWQMPAQAGTDASGVTSSFQALIDQTSKLTSNLRVTTDQMSSWDRAQMYAADRANAAADAFNTVAQTATVAAGGVAALSNSTQVAIAATTNAISGLVAMVAGVTGGAIGSMGAPQIGAPSIGGRQASTGGTGSGAGDQGFQATHPWLYGLSAAPSMNVTVDVSGSTIVGQQAMSNLSDTVANAMVGKLATMGIRLTRQ